VEHGPEKICLLPSLPHRIDTFINLENNKNKTHP
jgi:hypothetical protein